MRRAVAGAFAGHAMEMPPMVRKIIERVAGVLLIANAALLAIALFLWSLSIVGGISAMLWFYGGNADLTIDSNARTLTVVVRHDGEWENEDPISAGPVEIYWRFPAESDMVVDGVAVPNWLLFALLGIWPALHLFRVWRRRRQRTYRERNGLCLQCGYDLRGQTGPRCSECGCPVEESLLSTS